MKYFKIKTEYSPAGDQPEAIGSLSKGLSDKNKHQVLLGVTGSGKTFTIANIISKSKRPAIILAPNKTLAAQLYGEFKEFFPDNAVEYFVSYYDYYQPEAYVISSDTYIEKDASINEHIEQMRLSATKAMMERRDVIIVATVSAIYGLGDPDTFSAMRLHLYLGEKIGQRDIINSLVNLQYTRNDVALSRGNFRVRGDVIDVFPADSEKNIVRIELFDKEIEKIYILDSLTGAVIENIQRTSIYPKTHYVTPRETILSMIDCIKRDLSIRLQELEASNKLVEYQRLKSKTNYDIEMLLEMGYCTGIENYSRYLSGRKPGEPPPTLLDYLPKDGLIIIDESHVTIPQLGGMYKGDRARKENLVEYGFRLPSAKDNRPLRFDEFASKSNQIIYVSATPGKYELECYENLAQQIVRPTGLLDPLIDIRPATNQVDDLLDEVNLVVSKNEKVLVTTLTKKLSEKLTSYLEDLNIKTKYLHSDIDTIERVEIIRDFRKGKFDVLVGINLLREGLDIPEVSLVAILDADREGFLRSESSLIQTIGRASRNKNGRAILYADKETKSITKAVNETIRRRSIQEEHNIKHGIEPKTIIKKIDDVMGLHGSSSGDDNENNRLSKYSKLKQKEMKKEILRLEENMKMHAKSLEFEQASECRDDIVYLKDLLLLQGK